MKQDRLRDRNLQYRLPAQQVMQRKPHNLRRLHHVGNAHIFTRLVRQIEDAGTIGDAVPEPPDPVDMF